MDDDDSASSDWLPVPIVARPCFAFIYDECDGSSCFLMHDALSIGRWYDARLRELYAENFALRKELATLTQPIPQPCIFYRSPEGCRNGDECNFLHLSQ